MACADEVADAMVHRLRLPARVLALHQPCHDPDAAAPLLCSITRHVGADDPGVVCRECRRSWPCATFTMSKQPKVARDGETPRLGVETP